MREISEHANNLLNEFGKLQFDFAITLNNSLVSERDTARDNLANYIAELELELNNTKFHAKALQELLTKSMDRTAELEAANEKIDYFFRRLRMFCIFAHWDNPNTEAEFKKVDAEIRDYLSEYKVCIDQLAAHSDIERQDDKSPNDTQSQTIVYGKEDSEVQE